MVTPTTLGRIIAIAVSGIYSVVLFFIGFDAPVWWRYFISALPLLIAGLVMLWDLWAWHLKGVRGRGRRPDLRGFWRVSLTPHRESHIPAGGNRGPIDGFLEVRQTFWTFHVSFYTEQSSSVSTAWAWTHTPSSDVDSVTFTYDNTPRPSERPRSERSAGTCVLTPANVEPDEVEGTYFTDRLTMGDLVLTRVDRSRGHTSYQAAVKYAASKESKK